MRGRPGITTTIDIEGILFYFFDTHINTYKVELMGKIKNSI